ncbi:hypothetical protein WQ57_19885 [Mesobacillus campisalis]|uniref:Uncharacterized protein n=1 Tax=Mesobacillus campisalis TaxID=1408103 RepID=A0A0M2SQ48_9BACI|nr:hypothetical protein WQ57_19885 [Mesobacillus campisalis]
MAPYFPHIVHMDMMTITNFTMRGYLDRQEGQWHLRRDRLPLRLLAKARERGRQQLRHRHLYPPKHSRQELLR